MDTQLQAAWVVSDSYRLKLHGGLPDGCSRRAQDLLRILPSASRRLSPCWAEDFLVRQKIGAARGDHAPFLGSCYFLDDSLGAFTAGAPPLRDARRLLDVALCWYAGLSLFLSSLAPSRA